MLEPESYGRTILEKYPEKRYLGAGAFAKVYQHESSSGEAVAVKKVKKETHEKGVNLGAIKEIQVLRELEHPHVLKLLDVYPYDDRINMVLEFCPVDLDNIIKSKGLFKASQVKTMMRHSMIGLQYLHSKNVLHRDLKPENLLLGVDGNVKLADFGHAVFLHGQDQKLFPRVVTQWYRAPELLFGATHYGPAVDIWSMGCIFAEMLLRVPLFRAGPGEEAQLSEIFRIRGTPTMREWPGIKSLPAYIQFAPQEQQPLDKIFTSVAPEAIDLLDKMLCLNPSLRITASEVLKHPYFSTKPDGCKPEDLPMFSKILAERKRVESHAASSDAKRTKRE